MNPLTDDQIATFQALTSGHYTNLALASTTFDGVPCAVVIAVHEAEELSQPLAILVDDTLFERLANPFEEEEEEDESVTV